MKFMLFVIILLVVVFWGVIYYQNSLQPVLGVTNGRLKPLSDKPNNVSSQAVDEVKKVAPFVFKENLDVSMQAVLNAVAAYGAAYVIKEHTEDYLYIIFTTQIMKYHDDVEFWFDRDERLIHFRSSSRAGYSDMGLNRKRYAALVALYDKS